ncbi:MAG: Ig-like domain-containing protein [Kiritimatiellia bacterium]
MKCKWMVVMFFGALTGSLAQEAADSLAQVRIRVTDDAGTPVPSAQVAFSTYNTWVPASEGVGRGEYETVVGRTDSNGLVRLSLKTPTGNCGFMALPLAGYHWDKGQEYVFTNAVLGRWEPWSPLVEIVLKRRDAAPEGSPKEAKPAGAVKDSRFERPDMPR